MGKFLSDTQYVFALEPYTDGTPAPTGNCCDKLWQLLFIDYSCGSSFFIGYSLTLQKQRWSRHTLSPLLLLLWITGNRQSKSRDGLSWSEWRQCIFSTIPWMSWGTRARCLTSMGWRYSSSMSTQRFVCRLKRWKPHSCGTRIWLTPSSHSRKGRIVRARTHSTCLMGGNQTLERYQDSRTCCVQCWPTHPILVHLNVSLSSSIQPTMTITLRQWGERCGGLFIAYENRKCWVIKRSPNERSPQSIPELCFAHLGESFSCAKVIETTHYISAC